jgi:hypothetical protein
MFAAPVDEFDNPIGRGRLDVVLYTYNVVKVTPKGVQLDIGRFVLLSGRKRFAWPTPEEALASFEARKKRQLSILRAQAERVEDAIELAKLRFGPKQESRLHDTTSLHL